MPFRGCRTRNIQADSARLLRQRFAGSGHGSRLGAAQEPYVRRKRAFRARRRREGAGSAAEQRFGRKRNAAEHRRTDGMLLFRGIFRRTRRLRLPAFLLPLRAEQVGGLRIRRNVVVIPAAAEEISERLCERGQILRRRDLGKNQPRSAESRKQAARSALPQGNPAGGTAGGKLRFCIPNGIGRVDIRGGFVRSEPF